MSKQKKKRNKAYTGADATITRPIITRMTAVNRSKFGQWWFDRKRILKPVLITSGVILAIIIIVVELVRVISGA